MKQCILSESRFDFLKDLVKNIPDASIQEDNENNAIFEANLQKVDDQNLKPNSQPSSTTTTTTEPAKPTFAIDFATEQSSSTSRTPVIQFGPKVTQTDTKALNFSVNNLLNTTDEPKLHITIAEHVPVPPLVPSRGAPSHSEVREKTPPKNCDNIPPLIPISHHYYNQNTEDNLCIDEDYDN